MSLCFSDLTVTLQQRRLACVLDPALVLSPYGLAISRLCEVVDVWVVRELWHILDNTHFFTQRPALLVEAAARTSDTEVASQEALQALLDWEQWRLENDQASLKLFWVGDGTSGSLLPAGVDASVIWRYETLARALERQTDYPEVTDQVLVSAFRDAAALAAALRSSFILARLPLAMAPDSPAQPHCPPPVPPLCQALVQWGVPCTWLADHDPLVHIEREYVRRLLVSAGLVPLLWAGLRLAVVHLWVPGASTLWSGPHEAPFTELEELPPPLPRTLQGHSGRRRRGSGIYSERGDQMRTVLTRRHQPLAINQEELVMVAVMGQIANPVASLNPYRIGHDGIPRLLPATGGIVLNQRIGDRCVGLAGDHIEPGVSLHNNASEVIGIRQGPNLALLTYACVGNRVSVVSGPAAGQWGFVTGKHGGVYHVLVDFPPAVLRQLRIGDRMQIASVGLGLRLLDYPAISVFNSSPALLRAWGLRPAGRYLEVPVTHRVPASLMGSGLGQNTIWRGDYDIQLFDAAMRRRYRLDSLRFGDLVAIPDTDVRFGPALRQGYVTIGVIAHGDSTVSGHGPGVTPLLTGPLAQLRPHLDPQANLAVIFGVRFLPPARSYAPLVGRRAAALVPRRTASHRYTWAQTEERED